MDRVTSHILAELKELTESELYRRLMADPDLVQEVLDLANIRTSVGPLGQELMGMVYRSKSGVFHVVANQMLDYCEKEQVFLHELYHIICEAPRCHYLIRLDYTREEYAADFVAEAAAGMGFRS